MRFGGDVLYQLPSVTPLQCMGFVLAGEGDVLVVDGGTQAETDQLEELLENLGGKVTGWILTHAHFDHIQALIEILKRGKIKIGFVCYHFPDIEYVERVELRDGRIAVVRELEFELAAHGQKIVRPEKGKAFRAGHFSVLPLSAGNACGKDVPDPIDARVAASIRESAAQRERLVNHTLETKARDYEILKFYGEYNGCYAVMLNSPYGQFPAVDVDECEEIGGIRFHHTTHEPLKIWKSKG